MQAGYDSKSDTFFICNLNKQEMGAIYSAINKMNARFMRVAQNKQFIKECDQLFGEAGYTPALKILGQLKTILWNVKLLSEGVKR